MKQLIVYGAGGHAKSVLDSLDSNLYQLVGFIDNHKNGSFMNKPIFDSSFLDSENAKGYVFFIAIGDNESRDAIYRKIVANGLELITIIDKSAIVSKSATIGKGCYVGKYAIVNADAKILDNTIVNNRALVEHDCHVGRSCHISTNSVVNGNVRIGNLSFIGSSSVLIGQLTVGEDSVVGAGAVVVDDIPDRVVVVGVPAKFLKANSRNL